MNTKLLRKVQKHILAVPARLLMSEGLVKGTPGDTLCATVGTFYADESPNKKIPACGTVGCIAGWTCEIKKVSIENSEFDSKIKIWRSIEEQATKALGLNVVQADCLFDLDNWPIKFQWAYRKVKSDRARANVLSRRIDHFIVTKGAE